MKKLFTILAAALLLPCFCFGAEPTLAGVNIFTGGSNVFLNGPVFGPTTAPGFVGDGSLLTGLATNNVTGLDAVLATLATPAITNGVAFQSGTNTFNGASNTFTGTQYFSGTDYVASLQFTNFGLTNAMGLSIGTGTGRIIDTSNSIPTFLVWSNKHSIATFARASTNSIYVSLSGNDSAASLFNGIPFASLGAALAYASNNVGVTNIVMEAGYYGGQGALNYVIPSGVTIFGNGAWVSGNYFASDGDQIFDLNCDHTLLVSVTNSVNSIYAKGCRFGLALTETDAGELQNNAGYIRFDSCEFGNVACVSGNSGGPYNAFTWLGNAGTGVNCGIATNSLTEFYNCRFYAYNAILGGSSVGAHGLGIAVGTNQGGRIKLYGGSITCLAQTNLLGGAYLIGNSCISITGGPTTAQTTNFNTSLEIYGTTLIHGSTNGVIATYGLTNQLGIPVTGSYYECVTTNGFVTSTNYTGVNLAGTGAIQGNSGAYVRTNFISGQLYTNLYGAPIQVSTKAILTTTGVSGNSCMALEMVGNETNQSGLSTLVTSIATSYTNVLSGIVTNNGTYVFTNRSTGAGDSSAILGGQILIY